MVGGNVDINKYGDCYERDGSGARKDPGDGGGTCIETASLC